jgi:hypothetical protein
VAQLPTRYGVPRDLGSATSRSPNNRDHGKWRRLRYIGLEFRNQGLRVRILLRPGVYVHGIVVFHIRYCLYCTRAIVTNIQVIHSF